MNIIDFNLAYWSGLTQEWTYTIDSRLAGNALPRITQLNAAIEANTVRLVWPAVPGAASYRVYRAGPSLNRPDDPAHLYENWVFRPIGTTTDTSYVDSTCFETSRYAVAPVAADGTEGALSNRVFAPRLLNPWGIAVLPGNQRQVLDPQNGFAFMRQAADGVFIGNTGSEHNHVEWSRFIAIDRKLNRMLTSHPSDWYAGPHSIRVTDFDGFTTGMWDIGTRGSGPGQFETPGGVAVDLESRIYAVDIGNARVQVFDAGGSFLRAFGSLGQGPGQFNHPQGIAVDTLGQVFVCDTGNRRVVTVTDPLYLLDSFGWNLGDSADDPRCDFSNDATVDVVDLLSMIENFGA